MSTDPSSQDARGPSPSPTWTGRTRGGYYGNLFFIKMLRAFGLRGAFLPLPFVCAYYLLAHPAATRASAEYLARIFGPLPAWRRARGCLQGRVRIRSLSKYYFLPV